MDNTNYNSKKNKSIESFLALFDVFKVASSMAFLFILFAFLILILNNYISFNLNFTYLTLGYIYIISTPFFILKILNITLKNMENQNEIK